MLSRNHDLPLDFRQRDVGYVMQSLQEMKSCALVGVNGVGKTILMRHLLTPSLRIQYLRERNQDVTFVFINAHELSKPSALAYYRRMVYDIETALTRFGNVPSSSNVFSLANEPVVKELLFERVRSLISRDDRQSIVFLLDEFDVAFREIEPHFLRVLQALRQHADGRLCYVVACSNVPTLLSDEQQRRTVWEMFAELFDGNTYGIKPCSERDAYAIVENSLTLTGQHLQAPLRRYCLDIAGAHAGLLKAVVTAFVKGRVGVQLHQDLEQVIRQLLNDTSVNSRCGLLWNSLSENEQGCLKHMRKGRLTLGQADDSPASTQQFSEAIKPLLLKGVLKEVETGKVYTCFSALLAEYIAQRFPPVMRGLQLDVDKRQIWVDGILQPRRLPPKEFLLFKYLAAHADQVCTRDEIAREVYGEAYTPRIDAGRLDALVERTRRSIGDDRRTQRFLETIRGVGHRLKEYRGPR